MEKLSPSHTDAFRIAVLGQGTVGSEVISLLQQERDFYCLQAGVPITLSAIHTRNPRNKPELYARNRGLYRSIDEIVEDPDIDLVCELMGGIETARCAIKRALASGKHVVSANKALFAAEWPGLLDLAERNNVQVRFEAAVAGGVPILHALAAGSASERIEELRGIVNGTTNFILTDMEDNGTSYEGSLVKAQNEPYKYAESNPKEDVEGLDARSKLSLLIAYAFGKHIPPEEIPTRGIAAWDDTLEKSIPEVTLQDIEHAKSMGCRIKLVARAERVDGKVIARVGPELVVAESPIGQVPANFNAIEVRSNLNTVGNFYRGEGAGAKPTAASVVSDIVNIARQRDHGYVSPFGRPVQRAQNETDTRNHTFYVRFVIHDHPSVVYAMTGILGKYGINLNSIVQLPYDDKVKDALPFFITVEDTTEENLERALQEIATMDYNVEKPVHFRFGQDDLWRKHSS